MITKYSSGSCTPSCLWRQSDPGFMVWVAIAEFLVTIQSADHHEPQDSSDLHS